MKLHSREETPNFGDSLNLFLWQRLAPDSLDEDDSELFIGIGTLLKEHVPRRPKTVVFSTGSGYGPLPDVDDS